MSPELISNCRQDYQIEAEFQKALTRLGVKNVAQFISESPFDCGRRVYEARGRFYKLMLRRLDCTERLRNQTPVGEYKLLAALASCPGVPQEIEFYEHDEVFILSYEMLPGVPLDLKTCNLWQLSVLLWGLKDVLYALSKHGVCHNDIKATNVLVGGVGGPYLIDFDQATRAPFMKALVSNFVGWNKMSKTHSSFLGLIKSYLRAHSPGPIIQIYRQLKNSPLGRSAHLWAGRLKPLPKNASERLRHMHNAWEFARRSEANSPGSFICYYSLDFEGFHLPGERSWADRWQKLGAIADVRGKRILELGCNLSLLSCHFLMEGCAAALCVDKDADILAAAQKVAAAYEVTPNYRRVDFDAAEDWESDLAQFRPDIVTALSVMNWVKDKERFLAFLGRFNEVLFEGHDSEEVERDRLVRHGFKHVCVVAVSERDRPVFHGRK